LVQAHRIADQILCLPIHSRMTGDDVSRIAELVAAS
jgi:dTDP-4-amino-4,6-dideoxygalactose transaminase